MRLLLFTFCTTIPLISIAGGSINVMEDLYESIIRLLIFAVIGMIVFPLIIGLTVSFFFPENRFKVFKQVAIGCFFALLIIGVTFLILMR